MANLVIHRGTDKLDPELRKHKTLCGVDARTTDLSRLTITSSVHAVNCKRCVRRMRTLRRRSEEEFKKFLAGKPSKFD